MWGEGPHFLNFLKNASCPRILVKIVDSDVVVVGLKAFIYFLNLFISFVILQYTTYNTNKNNIHDYRQGDRNSVSLLLRARIRTYKHKNYLIITTTNSST